MTDVQRGSRVTVENNPTYMSGAPWPRPIRGEWIIQADRADSDGDVYIVNDEGDTAYVHHSHLHPVEKESNPELDGVWVAWYNGEDGRVITVHQEEIHALRWAINNGGTAKRLGYGEELIP